MATPNLNSVVITGNLTQDPELRSTASGASVSSLRVAVNTSKKNAETGEWGEKPNYFDATVWGGQGENACALFEEGPPLAVTNDDAD